MMKKVFKTLSAILLATACLAPGLAWADGNPSVALKDSGALKADNMVDVHSALVEVILDGDEVGKVTNAILTDAPSNAMSSAVYDAANNKITVAVSSGAEVLDLNNGSLGTVTIIADGASASTPFSVQAHLAAFEFIASEDSTSAVQGGSFDSNATATLESTQDVTPPDDEGTDSGNGSGNGRQDSDLDGMGTRSNDNPRSNGNITDPNGSGAPTTSTADYKANGVVSQAGQSTAGDANLVKTGDVLLICGIAVVVAAAVVFIAMGFLRKKGSSRK